MTKEVASEVSHVASRTVTSQDGITYTIETHDIIELNEEQYKNIKDGVLRKDAEDIEKSGVDIYSLTSEQVAIVLDEIKSLIGDSKNPLNEDIIRISRHISRDHAQNPRELERRNWKRETLEALLDDIENVVKEAFEVVKAKLKFSDTSKKSFPTFTFTILGLKVNEEQGKVSVAFIKNQESNILVVTII